jgi:hypothetical protein
MIILSCSCSPRCGDMMTVWHVPFQTCIRRNNQNFSVYKYIQIQWSHGPLYSTAPLYNFNFFNKFFINTRETWYRHAECVLPCDAPRNTEVEFRHFLESTEQHSGAMCSNSCGIKTSPLHLCYIPSTSIIHSPSGSEPVELVLVKFLWC